jgi:hypothetical protein
MFLIDSLLLAPGKALYFLLEEMARKAREEWLDDGSVKQELQEIYAMFEAGTLSEQEFEAREIRLVERLQQIARAKMQDNWGSPLAALDAGPMEPETIEPGGPGEEASPALPELLAPPSEAHDAVGATGSSSRRELPFSSIVASLAPLFEMAGGHGRQEGQQIETGIRMQPLSEAAMAAGPSFDHGTIDHLPQQQTATRMLPPPQVVAAIPTPAPSLPTVAAAGPAVTPEGQLPISRVIDSALKGLSVLQLKVSAVTSVARAEDGWRVCAELVERRGVPDTSDFLGLYELRLDHAGNVLQWERTSMRRRGDLGR